MKTTLPLRVGLFVPGAKKLSDKNGIKYAIWLPLKIANAMMMVTPKA
jgi:hypothetical protein